MILQLVASPDRSGKKLRERRKHVVGFAGPLSLVHAEGPFGGPMDAFPHVVEYLKGGNQAGFGRHDPWTRFSGGGGVEAVAAPLPTPPRYL